MRSQIFCAPLAIFKLEMMRQKSEAHAEETIVRPAGFSPVSSGMDIARPHIAKQKRRRRILFASGGSGFHDASGEAATRFTRSGINHGAGAFGISAGADRE